MSASAEWWLGSDMSRSGGGLDATSVVCMIHIMKSADLIKELEENGWVLDRVKGSHHVYKHPTIPEIITVPHPKKDLGRGLVNSARKIAGLK